MEVPQQLATPGGDSEDRSEAELMRQVAAGEIGGLEALYDRYHAMAYALALRITTETGLAEDVRGWLLAIVRHRAIDAMRRQRASIALGEEPDEALPPNLTLPDIWPEVAGRLDGERVREAIALLPPAQREAIELAYFDGLTQREIADRTGAPLGTVKSRMRLGLVSLREQLAGQYEEVLPSTPLGNGKKGVV